MTPSSSSSPEGRKSLLSGRSKRYVEPNAKRPRPVHLPSTKSVPARNIKPSHRKPASGFYITAGEKAPLLGAGRNMRPPARVYYGTGRKAIFVDLEANRSAVETCQRWERQWDAESCVLISVMVLAILVFIVLGWKTQARFEKP